jgi:uncharacterized hydrophobic protein (TIGR00271 family)
LNGDSADEKAVYESIKKNVEFKGANLWTLIFAIFIASIGLNVNSTAVVIGAMLISPLMGPIMGVGLGIGINDFELVKKSARNLLIATIIGIATSSLYFWITPLHEASSELLARTTPSIWDVFIAAFGGLAGIIAITRIEKSNVIPGVAIATALMPPLCTAGYAIASGNLYFFLGAIYLYFINSVFICLGTYLIIRYMKFHKKEFEDKVYEKKVRRYILMITIITVIPSIYLAYRIVDRSIFESNAKLFIQNELNFGETQVVSKVFKYNPDGNEVDLLLLGKQIEAAQLDSLKTKLTKYRLEGTKLIIRQGLDANNEIDISQIKASILETVYQGDSAKLINSKKLDLKLPNLKAELKVLYPDLMSYSVDNIVINRLDIDRKDTITMVVVNFKKAIPTKEKERLRFWLKSRIGTDSLQLLTN